MTDQFTGKHFWARGYFASPVGRDKKVIREYIRNHEKEDEQRIGRLCGNECHRQR